MERLRTNIRAAVSLGTAIPVLIITAILGGVSTALSYVAGLSSVSVAIGTSALIAGIVEFLTLYRADNTSLATISLKTLLGIVGGAIVVLAEYLTGQTVFTEATVISAAAIVVAYLQQSIAAYVNSGQVPTPPAPTPPS